MFKFFKKRKKFDTEQMDWRGSKDYDNPYFHSNKNKNKKRFEIISLHKHKIFLALGLAILIYFIYFFLYSPFFRINQIEILGLQNLSSEKIKGNINDYLDKNKFLIFPNRNSLFFNQSKMAEILINEYVLEQCDIKKKDKNTITVQIKERLPQFVWVTNHLYYGLDSKGTIINQAVEDEKQKLINIYDIDNQNVFLGENILLPDILNKLTSIKEKINFAELKFDSFRLKKNLSGADIKVMTDKGIELIFDMDNNLEKQFQNLAFLLSDKLKGPALANLTYIDLRLIDKVYYK